MPNVTIVVPDDLKADMESQQGVNWSEVARQAFIAKLESLSPRRIGTLVKRLEEILTPEETKKREGIEKVGNEEAKRFEEEWGATLRVAETTSKPYVQLTARPSLTIGRETYRFTVTNERDIDVLGRLFKFDDPQLDERMKRIVNAFRDCGFEVKRESMVLANIEKYVYPEEMTADRRALGRELNSKRVDGYFADNGKDLVFIDYRPTQRK